MTRSLPRLLCLPAVLAVAVAGFAVDPRVLAGSSDDAAGDDALTADPDLAAADRELDARLATVFARTAAKEDLIARLLDGRLGLAAATDGFVRLNADVPGWLELLRYQYPGADDREAAARNVLEFARQRTPRADWPAVARRLAGEFEGQFGHPSGL